MNADLDSTNTWLDKIFARSVVALPRHYVQLWLLVTSVGILALAWPAQYFTEGRLWGPGASPWPGFAVTMGIGVLIILVTTARTLRVHFRPIIRFMRGDDVAPQEVWFATVRRLPRAALEFTLAFTLVGDTATVAAVGIPRHFRWWGYVDAWMVAAIITAAAGFFFVLIWEVAFRPVLRQLQPLLPREFEAKAPWLTLGRRSALASASAMGYTGAAVACLTANTADRELALAIALLATIGSALSFGGAITGLVAHSLFMRVSELERALVRIGRREYDVRVEVRAGDELDAAAASLNQMANRLERADARLRGSRARLAFAADRERERMQRDLRHLVLERLLAIGDELDGLASRELAADPEMVRSSAAIRSSIEAAAEEIERLVRGVYPTELATGGLDAALAVAADRMPLDTTVVGSAGRLSPQAESATYFCCREALHNAAKHAGADAEVLIELARDDHRLAFSVSDSGAGFPATEGYAGRGLVNMRDRIGAVGGDLTISSEVESGTRVAGWVPIRQEDLR